MERQILSQTQEVKRSSKPNLRGRW